MEKGHQFSIGYFLPGAMSARQFSEETAREIDLAVRAIVKKARDAALERGAEALLRQETLAAEELRALMDTPSKASASPARPLSTVP